MSIESKDLKSPLSPLCKRGGLILPPLQKERIYTSPFEKGVGGISKSKAIDVIFTYP
jgi:hypothetical protein